MKYNNLNRYVFFCSPQLRSLKTASVLGLVLLSLSTGCFPKKKMPSPGTVQQVQPEQRGVPVEIEPSVQVFASIKKTACFGSCPVFEAVVKTDGSAFWKGEKNVGRIGNFSATAPEGWMKRLAALAEQIGYSGFANHYPTNGKKIADFPSTSTSMLLGKKSRGIENNFDAPAALIEFENKFAEMLEELEWKSGGE